MKVRVVTSGRVPELRAFLNAWAHSKSMGVPLYLEVGAAEADDLSDDAYMCGGFVGQEIGEAARRKTAEKFANFNEHKRGWAQKVYIMRQVARELSPGEIGVWLDHDVEVRGDLRAVSRLFADGTEKMGAPSMGAPLYRTMGTGRFPRTRAGQNGMFLFTSEAEWDLATWWQTMCDKQMPNDEAGFVLAFGGGGFGEEQVRKAEEKLWDVMGPPLRLYASCDCYAEIRERRGGLRMATARLLADKDSLVRHWCANVGKRQFLGLWGK